MSKLKLSLIFLSLTQVIGGCGGGGDSASLDGLSVTPSFITVSGSVPGTLIEALCEDGSYWKTTSIKNGSTEDPHPFELSLPANTNCKLIMTTNETDPNPANWIITPIIFSNGTSNSATFNTSEGFSTGFVPLVTSGTSGVQSAMTLALNDSNVQIIEHAAGSDLLDSNNDGVPNAYDDDDHDGIYKKDDEDERSSNDRDGDGVQDEYDRDSDNDGTQDNNTGTPVAPPTTFSINAGRLLGSQCAQCHGTNGVSSTRWDSLAGSDDVSRREMEEEGGIMAAQAHGYTDAEIQLLDAYFRSVSRTGSTGVNSGDDHDD
jgi:hypothetical protein